MNTQYNPQDVEEKWYEYWEKHELFHSVPDDREPYTIVIPPPNVTGVLHMGHMLNNTIQDLLIRRARMQGYNACWVPGSDHASIATEAKVVKMLKEKGISKHDIGREEFLKHAWEWTDKYGGIIFQQLRKLGVSCDWSRTRFTLEDKLSDAVVKVFVDLYRKGKIYRANRIGHWDVAAQTALSDQEVIYKDVNAKLYHVRYKIEGTEDEWITVATTRPETIMGDTAVCFHPEDERYQHLKGKKVLVPLINRAIPIIYDEYVDMEFGTGGLKITPAHDANDFALGKKHNLEIIDVLNPDGTMSEAAQLYIGEDRDKARKLIAKDLEAAGNLVKVEDLPHKVGFSERTNVVVEPRITPQWYMRMEETAKPALEAVMNDTIQFFPSKYKNTYRHWMENIRDWCISRQLWWGQRIPIYYLADGSHVCAETAEEALELAKAQSGNSNLTAADLQQDPDVVDTWFSSWLWPISVFDGFENRDEVDYYYPTSVLVTGWDILFLWVARMVMAGYEWEGQYPFKDVYYTGMVRDKQGRKMSKSLGNSPDPLGLIEEYGADGVRVGLLMSSPAGGDLLFDNKLCEQGRNFSNKIWNALRLVKGWEVKEGKNENIDPIVDWFENRFNQVVAETEKQYETYSISEALKNIYSFVWNDFFSVYLEMAKPEYQQPIDQYTYDKTIELFEKCIKLVHPFMPFLTEEIYHNLKDRPEGDSICIAKYPEVSDFNQAAIDKGEAAKELLTKLRDLRNSQQLKQREPLQLSVKTDNPALFEDMISLLKRKAFLESFDFTDEDVSGAVSFRIDKDTFFVPLGDKVDLEEERQKIQKELDYLEGLKKILNKKLGNERFVSNAPAAVVDMEKKKLADTEGKIGALMEQLGNL
ncbi:MAG: valine--tRNA ligase [Chitinophagales bacterium]